MNSEELELSLRTEFESCLKNALADMRQEVSDFQAKFQAEFEKHKNQLDDGFRELSSRLENDPNLDDSFKESVVEHLRLARDEGARITASAIAEAEKLDKETAAATPPSAENFAEIRDAVNDISRQNSQSAILKSLVNYAAQFTPRGAFFIIKNEHFVGWRVFGAEAEMDEQAVREIHFPMTGETILSESARSLSAVESSYGTYADDSIYLDKLEFGQPDRMYAVPLIARSRAVAVLYVDGGQSDEKVNIAAIETLIRVAGLTVELLAASQTLPKPQTGEVRGAAYAEQESLETSSAAETESVRQPQPAAYGFAAEQSVQEESSAEKTEFASYEDEVTEVETADETVSNEYDYAIVSKDLPEAVGTDAVSSAEPAAEIVSEYHPEIEEAEAAPEYSWNEPAEAAEAFDGDVSAAQDEQIYVPADEAHAAEADSAAAMTTDFAFEPSRDFEPEQVRAEETEAAAQTAESADSGLEVSQERSWEVEAAVVENGTGADFEAAENVGEPQYNGFEQTNGSSENFAPAPAETVRTEEAVATPVKTRFSDRNVDLPIEVSDEERRLHNDARRFARLLVSEIKLYNEQKVKEGREENDLYDRLREAIDRSREMYDKRVHPPVAAKFDYFHYELVSNLAEGDEHKLGGSYPGTMN